MQGSYSDGAKRDLKKKYNNSILEQAGGSAKVTKEPRLITPAHDISGRFSSPKRASLLH